LRTVSYAHLAPACIQFVHGPRGEVRSPTPGLHDFDLLLVKGEHETPVLGRLCECWVCRGQFFGKLASAVEFTERVNLAALDVRIAEVIPALVQVEDSGIDERGQYSARSLPGADEPFREVGGDPHASAALILREQHPPRTSHSRLAQAAGNGERPRGSPDGCEYLASWVCARSEGGTRSSAQPRSRRID
jgi:hypothetical protein